MKLQLVPAGAGWRWVKLGINAFMRQPIALSGLFFVFMALMSVLTLLPFIGSVLALALLPAATLGLMAASREAEAGRFPMPTVLVTAFRAGQQRVRSMLVLGAWYAAGFLLVMGASTLADGGDFARLYLVGGKITPELLQRGDFQAAAWLAMLLYLPLSLLFWHAPGLVHWHGISPAKSLFFSGVACLRNWKAFLVYGLAWTGLFTGAIVALTSVAAVTGSVEVVQTGWLPLGLMLLSMLFASIYFSFRDCFIESDSPPPATPAT